MAGIDDIEKEESPEELLERLQREKVFLTDSDIQKIMTGRWNGKKPKQSTPQTTTQTTQQSTGTISTLANSDSTNPTGSTIVIPQNRPVEPPVEKFSYLYYDIWLKKGNSPYEDLTPHTAKFYYSNKGALIASLPIEEQLDENAVKHRYRFCRCEGDPDNVDEIRANARMGWAPRAGVDRAKLITEAGYYVKFPKDKNPGDPNASYAPDYTEPMWILNQRNEVQYIGDDKCPEGKKRYTDDSVVLGKEQNIPDSSITGSASGSNEQQNTITYEKVEIERIEYKGANVFLNGAQGPKIESIKYPPIIIDSITIPSGSTADANNPLVLSSIEIIKEPFVVGPQNIPGNPPRDIIDDVRIEPITFSREFIKIKGNLPITFRSITMPAVIIDSLDAPKTIPETATIPPIIASDEVIYLPEKEYSMVDFEPSEIQSTGSYSEIKGETVILKNIELKVPIKDRATNLKFWKSMVEKPEIKIEDEKNEQLTVKIPNVMIPLSPKPTQTIDKLITSRLLLDHNLIKYAPDDTEPTADAKNKYIIYTMTGRTVPPIGEEDSSEDGSTIYYGVNEPFRDETPVKNEFEYCKCSGDTGDTSYQRGNARLGILQAGMENKKYFKRSDNDVLFGKIGVYIGDDKCPDGESKVTTAEDPSDNAVTLIPDKQEILNFSDIVLDLKDIVMKNPREFNTFPSESFDKLPKITISNLEVPIELGNGGTTKKGTETIPIPKEKIEQKNVVSQNNIVVQEQPPKVEEQIATPPPKNQNAVDGSKKTSKEKKKEKKQKAKKKGEKDALTRALEADAKKLTSSPSVDIGEGEAAIDIDKGRDVPKPPGNPSPSKFTGKGLLQGTGYGRRWDGTGNNFADWQWLWPVDATYKPGSPEGTATFWTKGNSRPSESKLPWWSYLSEWNSNEPTYGKNDKNSVGGEWTGGDVTNFYDRIGKVIMFDPQYAPFSMAYYKSQVGPSMKLNAGDVKAVPKLGKEGDYVHPPLSFTFRIWRITDSNMNQFISNPTSVKWQYSRSGPAGSFRFPYMIAGRSLIRQYVPRAFNADWNTLLKKFRLSKGVDPDYVDPNIDLNNKNAMSGKKDKNKKSKPPQQLYGGPLPADYQPSLLDVGIIMNFMQSGYVNRYKLPSGGFPPLASSGTEQHLMMVHTVTPDWVKGRVAIDPMVGTFNRGTRINLNWAHEPHWCGISTDFFLRKGGFASQGTTSVKSNEGVLINKGFPLNRPRLEENITDEWDPKKWVALDGVGTTIREVYKKMYVKHGRDYFEHPITPEYLNSYGKQITSIWFIEGIHFQKNGKGKNAKLTQKGFDMLKLVLDPTIIDWPGATISHTGHVESVACMDIDGDVMRLGGNTSTDGNKGQSNNTMGLFQTHLGDFAGYPPQAGRGGFVVIGRPEGYDREEVKKARVKPGIASPWIITPVIQTYFDFVTLNPDPEYPVFNTYWERINYMQTVMQSKHLKG